MTDGLGSSPVNARSTVAAPMPRASAALRRPSTKVGKSGRGWVRRLTDTATGCTEPRYGFYASFGGGRERAGPRTRVICAWGQRGARPAAQPPFTSSVLLARGTGGAGRGQDPP